MKLTVTKEDLRNVLLQITGLDIDKATVEVEIEGYVKAKDYKLKAVVPATPPMTVTTDANMNVIGITHEVPKKSIPRRKGKRKYTYTGPVDYTEYKNEILDFATSNEDKRAVPTFGLTLACIKERYKKVIKQEGVQDMVRFGRINSEPYLIRVKETV